MFMYLGLNESCLSFNFGGLLVDLMGTEIDAPCALDILLSIDSDSKNRVSLRMKNERTIEEQLKIAEAHHTY